MRDYPAQSHDLLGRLFDPSLIVWLALIETEPGSAFLITNHGKDVVHAGIAWQSFPMKLDKMEDSGKGDLPSSTLTISNVGRITMPILEAGQWRQGLVLLLAVFKDFPDLPPLVSLRFRIQGAAVTTDRVSLLIGQQNLHEQQFPRERFLRLRFPAIPLNPN